ncbi:MAG: DUF167 domain-containing protein [Victivallaceae bacterium]
MPIPSTAIQSDPAGAALECHIQPGATRGRFLGDYDGKLKIAVAAPPVDGKANQALIVFLSKSLDVPKSRIKLVRGESSRSKRLVIIGLSQDALRRLLEESIED